jgi:hypothetical protein
MWVPVIWHSVCSAHSFPAGVELQSVDRLDVQPLGLFSRSFRQPSRRTCHWNAPLRQHVRHAGQNVRGTLGICACRRENRFQTFTSFLRYVFLKRLHVREPATTMHRPFTVDALLDVIETDSSTRCSRLFAVSLAPGMAFHRAISRATDLPLSRRPPVYSLKSADTVASEFGGR